MSLPEVMLEGLKEGRLPKYTGRSISELILLRVRESARRRLIRSLNASSEVRHALLAALKPVVIKSHNLTGYVSTMDDVLLAKVGTKLTFSVNCENKASRPTVARVYVGVKGLKKVEKVVHVLFMPHASYTASIDYQVDAPSTISCQANVSSEYRYLYDSVSRSHVVGVLNDRYKPVEEYPTPNADNVALDIPYSWRTGSFVYPTPTPEGLSFTDMSIRYKSGFMRYEDKQYKDPRVDNRVEIAARINNNTGSTLTVKHWGLPLSVLYEDDRHVSQIDAAVSFPTRTVANGGSIVYSIELSLPTWCYGKVAVAHALSFYKNGNPVYYGGPVYLFEVFRVMLP